MKNAYIRQMLLLAIMLIASTIANAQWTQIGNDIDGESQYDYSGCSVSLSDDASVVAIGAFWNNGSGMRAGHVRVYQNNAGTWTQIGSDIDGEAAWDYSGWTVSLSADGSVVAIGALTNDGNGSDAGHVRIYENISGTWTQIGADIDGEAASDESGCSVSLSSDGSVVAVGAHYNDGNGSDAGHVRIYENISGTWTQIGSDIDGETANDRFGNSICLNTDGSVVAIGAYWNCANGMRAGHVRIYQNNAGTWTQVGSDIDGEAAWDFSGNSVSLSADGSVVAIGARLNGGNGSEAGHVRVYQNNAGTWTQIGSDIDGEAAGDNSGWSVSLCADGSVVAIGAPLNDANAAETGHVRVYKNNAGTWTQIGIDIDGVAAYDYFGHSVSLSADGSVVAIGATEGATTNAGQVKLFSCKSYSTITLSACDIYISPSGNYTWTSSGTYTDTIPNTAGCDSVITIDLTIETVDVSVTQNGNTLTANLSGASYQWIDCNNSYLPIIGDTNQIFTPTVTGNYAVIVDDGICVDTSICCLFIGLNEQESNLSLFIYPNPTKGKISIECKNMQRVEVVDITGKVVYEQLLSNDVYDIDISAFSKGVYFVKVFTADAVAVERIVLE